MDAMRDGCRAAVEALEADGALSPSLTATEAVDLLWTMLSVENWEQLTKARGWSEPRYLHAMRNMAKRTLMV